MRFELVDQVLERGPERLRAVKTVTSAEEYLADHFPGFPVLPGVMMLEAMVQAARHLAADQPDAPAAPLVVADVRNVKYGQLVRPGQALIVEVTLRQREAGELTFQGEASVDGQTAAQGRFRLRPLAEQTTTAA